MQKQEKTAFIKGLRYGLPLAGLSWIVLLLLIMGVRALFS
jgi:hypothetical protein